MQREKVPLAISFSFSFSDVITVISLITVRHSSCGRVMFSQACVRNFVYRGWCPPPDRHPPGETRPKQAPPRPPRDGHCRGWYASYWNAFLFSCYFEQPKTTAPLHEPYFSVEHLPGDKVTHCTFQIVCLFNVFLKLPN